jgi:Rha family phage regulatory protein
MNTPNVQHPDLFPATLLVSLRDGRAETDSLKVAAHFHKRHTHVLDTIEQVIADLAKAGDARLKVGGSDLGRETESGGRKVGRETESGGPDLSRETEALDFERTTYVDQRGKTQPMYRLSRNAFNLVALRFTGARVLVWQVDYVLAFESMEHALTQMTQRYAHALDIVRPNIRPVVEDTLAGLSRAAIAQRLGKSCGSVSYHRGQGRKFGLLAAKGGKA